MALNVLSVLAFVVVGVSSSYVHAPGNINDISQNGDEENVVASETVRVDLYYESLCPDCIAEYPQLPPLVKKLGDYLYIYTYPYGNARMEVINNKTVVKCQHGELECYGNKLHACAIHHLKSVPLPYINYNACLMALHSNDTAADSCGHTLQVNSERIKKCAKGKKGHDLLVYYGRESEKVTYSGVPYVLVNNKPIDDNVTIWDAVCEAFKNPPSKCNKSESDNEAMSI